VGGWLQAWLSREKKRPTTMASRRYLFGLLPRWFLKLRLNDESLSPAHVARVLDELLATPTSRGEPRAPKTVADVRTTLVRALGQAQRWGLLSRNPAALVDPPYVPETAILPLSIDEARSLLDAVAGHRLESLYTVAISHGIRMSEAIGAQWSYVDLAAGTFEVWPTLTRTMEGEVVEGGTKHRRRRRFFLTATAVEQLHVHEHRLAEECRMLGDAWTLNNLVWPSQVGTPLGHRALLRHLHGACARAGIRRVSFHTLRHSAAALQSRAGCRLPGGDGDPRAHLAGDDAPISARGRRAQARCGGSDGRRPATTKGVRNAVRRPRRRTSGGGGDSTATVA